MLNWLKRIFISEKCTHCGKPFERLPWGGRVHYSKDGRSWSVHPIDYIYTMYCKDNEESRKKIAELEETERIINNVRAKMGKGA